MTFRNFGVVLSARCRLSVVGPNSSGVLLLRPLFKRASILPERDIKAASTLSLSVDLISDASLAVSMWMAVRLFDLFGLPYAAVGGLDGTNAIRKRPRVMQAPNLWLNGLLSLKRIRASL